MEAFEKIYVNGVFVIAANLSYGTINEAKPFRKIVKEDISSGHTKLVIDISKCGYIDSTFFGVIIMASKMLIDIGYKLKVVKPNVAGEFIFISTDTIRLLDIYETREEAIKSFEEDIQPES